MIDKATMITGEKGNTKTGNSQGENIRIETPEKEINQKQRQTIGGIEIDPNTINSQSRKGSKKKDKKDINPRTGSLNDSRILAHKSKDQDHANRTTIVSRTIIARRTPAETKTIGMITDTKATGMRTDTKATNNKTTLVSSNLTTRGRGSLITQNRALLNLKSTF